MLKGIITVGLRAVAISSFAILVTATAPDAHAQCLKCTTTVKGGGSCDVDPATNGYETCSCPCQCEGFCGQNDTRATPVGDVLAKPGLVGESRSIRVTDPSALLARAERGRGMGGLVYEEAWFLGNIGLVRFANGDWRAYPLESDHAFVIRTCGGGFVGRVYRDSHFRGRTVGSLIDIE